MGGRARLKRRLVELDHLQAMTDLWIVLGLFAVLAAVLWIGTDR